jgi:glutathione S-transferase
MADIIVHHYPISPFAHKLVVALALKKIPFKSLIVHNTADGRPLTNALTGGYRRIPIMQVGADIYCDTQLALDVLESLYPNSPSLIPTSKNGNPEKSTALAYKVLADKFMFANVLIYIPWDKFGAEFLADRSKFIGAPIDPAKAQAAQPIAADQLHFAFKTLNDTLSDGRKFLLGENPTHADIHPYVNVWFLKQIGAPPSLLEGYPHLCNWAARIEGIVKDTMPKIATKITPQVSFDAAKAGSLKAIPSEGKPDVQNRAVGKPVSVTPDDTAKVSTVGVLVSIDTNSVVIRREGEWEGKKVTTNVHFPRYGFIVRAVSAKL